MSLNTVKLIEFKENGILGSGVLSFIENGQIQDFNINRVYWIYGTGDTELNRGNHAHKYDEQVIICLHGQIEIEIIDQKNNTKNYILNSPNKGLFIPKLLWKNILVAPESIILCISSSLYKTEDYIKNFSDFLNYNS